MRKGPTAEEGIEPTAMSEQELMTSQREAPRDLAGVLDEGAQTLFLSELWRGLALTMKVFWEPKVTINCEPARRLGLLGLRAGAGCARSALRLLNVLSNAWMRGKPEPAVA